MSDPTPPGTTRMHPALKWAIGCGIGCLVLLLACAGLCGFGYFGVLAPFAQRVERSSKDEAMAREVSARIQALDVEFPATVPEDVAAAELTDEQVLAYLRVRAALAEPLDAVDRTLRGAVSETGRPPSPTGVLRQVAGMVDAGLDAQTQWLAVLEQAEPLLRQEGMGPTDLGRLAEIVEWRFLRRPQAMSLGLEAGERAELEQLHVENAVLTSFGTPRSGMRVNGRDAEEIQRRLTEIQSRIAELEAKAQLAVALAGTTLATLERHRVELEARPVDAARLLADLASTPSFFEGFGAFGDHSGDITISSEDDAGDEPPEAPDVPQAPRPALPAP